MNREFQYVPLSTAAVASVSFGCLASLSLVQSEFSLFALPGIFLGILAVGRTRTYELAGRSMARVGILLCAIMGCAGPTTDYVQHLRTVIRFREEAPDGYQRVDFSKLITPIESRESGSRETLDAYLGQKICLKGYLPFSSGIKRWGEFPLTADDDNRATLDEKILIRVDDSFCQDWSSFQEWPYDGLAVSGILAVIPQNRRGSTTPKYELQKPVVRQSQSPFQLVGRKGTKC